MYTADKLNYLNKSIHMKAFLIILGSALLGAIVLVFTFKMIKLKIAFARQAQNLSDKELEEAVLDLWEKSGERFSFKTSCKLDIFENESQRRKLANAQPL